MGDRCYLSMQIRKRDEEKWTEVLGHPVEDEFNEFEEQDDDFIHCVIYEANYAMYDELQEWAAKGLEFEGQHGEGGNYGAYYFVTHDKEVLYARQHEGDLVVRVNTKGEIEPDTLKDLQQYLTASAAFTA